MIKDKVIDSTQIATILIFCGLFINMGLFMIATAEEPTVSEVVEWLNILNPSNVEAHATLTIHYKDGRVANITPPIIIPARSKGVVKLNDYAEADKSFGTVIKSSQPVVAQLAHYEPDRGKGAIGSTELAKTWYFADGYVSSDCLEWLNILNPLSDDANATISLYHEDGMIVNITTIIPAHSKLYIKLNERAEQGTPFGTSIESDQPIVAQLAHYESDRGHGDIGSTDLANRTCGSVEAVGTVGHPYAMAEEHYTIYLCRDLKGGLQESWPEWKSYN